MMTKGRINTDTQCNDDDNNNNNGVGSGGGACKQKAEREKIEPREETFRAVWIM